MIAAKPLETAEVEVDGIRWTHVFYEDGLAINVLYTLADAGKRAVGFKLSDGMDVPAELADRFSSRAEVQARRHDPRLLLRHQRRVLTRSTQCCRPGRSGRRRRIGACDSLDATSSAPRPSSPVPRAAWVRRWPTSCATEGADVLVLVDWHAERLGLVATAIRDRAPDVKVDTHVVDLGSRADLDALVADLRRAHDHIDLLVNNAGVALFGRFAQMTIADFEWVTDINLRAPIVLTHGLLPNLLRADGAHVINTSSLFGLIAPRGKAPIVRANSVSGLLGVTRCRTRGRRRRVTTVHPGGIRTRIATSARAAASVAAGDVEVPSPSPTRPCGCRPSARPGSSSTRPAGGSHGSSSASTPGGRETPRLVPSQMRRLLRIGSKGACVAEPHLDRTGDEAILEAYAVDSPPSGPGMSRRARMIFLGVLT